jgi:hypothetical protein
MTDKKPIKHEKFGEFDIITMKKQETLSDAIIDSTLVGKVLTIPAVKDFIKKLKKLLWKMQITDGEYFYYMEEIDKLAGDDLI